MVVENKKKPQQTQNINPTDSARPSALPRLFLLIGGFFGLIMLVLTPPFQVPDEHDHFFRAIMIASGQFIAKNYPFPEKLKKKVPQKYLQGKGGIVPISIPYTTRKVNHQLPFHPDNKQQLNDLKKILNLPMHMQGLPDVFIITSAGGYAPPLYLPAVLAIAAGKALDLSPLWLMYLSRLANLMVFLSLIYWTLKITPTGKTVFFLLALMPMTLFLAPSLSIDGLTIASSFLLTATLLDLARNNQQPVDLKAWFIVPTTLTLLALGKIVYCPLILLLFLSPRALTGPERSRLYLLLSSLALAGLSFLLWHQCNSMAEPLKTANAPFDYTCFQFSDKLLPLLDSKKQFQMLLHHPGTGLTILIRTLLTQSKHYVATFIGVLGWLDTHLPIWVYATYPPVLVLSALQLKANGNNPLIEKTLLIFIWGLCTNAILFGFYILSSPFGNAVISGVQGRYFIPIAMPLLLALAFNYRLPKKIRRLPAYNKISAWPVLYCSLVLFTTIYTLWVRYY